MKGYISDIPKEELLKKREEYWNTRIEGDPETWNTLKMCCSEETSEGNLVLLISFRRCFSYFTNNGN